MAGSGQYTYDVKLTGNIVKDLRLLQSAAKKAGVEVDTLGDKAGDADTALKGVAGALGIVSPELELLFMRAGDALGGLEGIERVGKSVGVNLSGSMVAGIGAAAGGLLAMGAAAMGTYEGFKLLATVAADATASSAALLGDGVKPLLGELENREAIEQYSEEVERLDLAWTELKFAIADQAAPAMVAATRALTSGVAELAQRFDELNGAGQDLRDWMQSIAGGAGPLGISTALAIEGVNIAVDEFLPTLKDLAPEEGDGPLDRATKGFDKMAKAAEKAGEAVGGTTMLLNGVALTIDQQMMAALGFAPEADVGPLTQGKKSAPRKSSKGMTSVRDQQRDEMATAIYRDLYPTAPAPTADDLAAVMVGITPPSVMATLTDVPTGISSVGIKAANTPGAGLTPGIERENTDPTAWEGVTAALANGLAGIENAVSTISSGRFSGGWWAEILNLIMDIGQMGASGIEEKLIEMEDSVTGFFNALPEIPGKMVDHWLRTSAQGGLMGQLIEVFPDLAQAIWKGFMEIFPNLSANFIQGILSAFGLETNGDDIKAATRVGQGIATGGMSEIFRLLSGGASNGFAIGSEI